MKKTIFLVLITLSSLFMKSQTAVAPHETIENFFKTTTCVVLTDDIFNIYNGAIKRAIEEVWTVTPYKFISVTEFENNIDHPEYSFLVLTSVFKKNTISNNAYSMLRLVVGEKNKSFEDLPEICSFPLSYDNVDYGEYDYKMSALVLFMQNHIKITYNNPDLNNKNILNYYNKNIIDIGNKTIYFYRENLDKDVNTVKKIAEIYPKNVKIVEEDVIEKLITDKDTNAIILHMVAPPNIVEKLKCYKMLIGAGDGKLYYYDYHITSKKKPNKFLKSDFIRLSKK